MKRITAFMLALAILFTTTGSAVGHTGSTQVFPWQLQAANGYNHYIYVCDVGFSGAGQDRIIDAAASWNSINGELRFVWTNYTDSTCNSVYSSSTMVVRVRWASLAGDLLGQTWPQSSGSSIIDCDITIDNNGTLASWGSYTWYTGTGSPGATSVDIESTLVHELGHCVWIYGHSNSVEGTSNVMYTCLNPSCGSPKGINKDVLQTHDTGLYAILYGTTH